MSAPHAYQLGVLALTAVAALFDWRTGRIPNWLTLGALALALPFHGWMTATLPNYGPLEGVKWAVLGATACTLPMLAGWRLGWIAGGDVKLVAAMGALGGLSLGLEAVFLALLSAASFIVLRLAWNGTFFRTVGDGVTFAVGRALYKNKNATPELARQATVRLGPFALAGAALSLVLHGGIA